MDWGQSKRIAYRQSHLHHDALAGRMPRRGGGRCATMTLSEYLGTGKDPGKKLCGRLGEAVLLAWPAGGVSSAAADLNLDLPKLPDDVLCLIRLSLWHGVPSRGFGLCFTCR